MKQFLALLQRRRVKDKGEVKVEVEGEVQIKKSHSIKFDRMRFFIKLT